jgi:hypothetical protein
MSKRLQVVLEDEELREIQQVARGQRLTVAEWVRQTLRAARREQQAGHPRRKLVAVRAAVRHSFPTGDIEQMLAEIARGYLGGSGR